MKMKKIVVFVISLVIMLIQQAPVYGWGSKGHIVITNIAEKHLSKKAKKEVRKLLGGYSMVYYSTWMDDIRSNPAFTYTRTWHYANVDDGKTYETMDKEPAGDVITATILSINQLKNKNQADSVRSMYLKFLIHLIADMHCPMHAGRATDRGGNDFTILWNKSKTNLHSFWDYTIIDAAKDWNSIEWSTYIDIHLKKKQLKAIQAGDPADWFMETVVLAKDVYKNTTENQAVSQNYVRNYTPVIEDQFRKAGYRLAGLINSAFK